MIDKKTLEEMQEYVEVHLHAISFEVFNSAPNIEDSIHENIQQIELEDFINTHRKPSLKQVLFELIDKKGSTDSEIYKKAGIDRRHFSKIRSNPDYRPGKNTAIALALALELSQEDTEELLSSAGYSLSDSETRDLVVQFCIEKKIFDLHLVNQALDHFSLKPLTG